MTADGKSPLLKVIGTVALPATTEPFVVATHFVVNTDPNAPVRIAYVGDNFKAWFSPKVEAPTEASILRYSKLVQPARDALILVEFGENADTTLAAIWRLLERQPHGEAGTLENDGCANIFYVYVTDVNGVRRAVGVDWRSDGWDVSAYSVVSPDEWLAGDRVFSRSPC